MLDPEDWTPRSDGSRSTRRRRYAVAPLVVDGAAGCIVALVQHEDFGERELRAARRARAPGEARDRECVELRGARADASSRPSRRSRTRSRRTTSTRRRTRAGSPTSRCGSARELGLDERDAQAPRARRAAPRHRQDRHPERDPLEAGPPHRRGARDRSRRIRSSASGSSRRSTGSRTCGRSSATATSAGTARGYPDGIAGEDIPLESRIIFVCDAYHAMTTDRPYRQRLSHPEARAPAREGAGTQFDPRVVEVASARARA